MGRSSDETGKTEVPCPSRCGPIKNPPCSKVLSAEHSPKFCSPSPVMVTFPYKWLILERDVKPQQSTFVFLNRFFKWSFCYLIQAYHINQVQVLRRHIINNFLEVATELFNCLNLFHVLSAELSFNASFIHWWSFSWQISCNSESLGILPSPVQS
jgi:hypothetical protein